MVAHSALLHHQHFIPTPPAQLGSSLRAPTTHQRVRIRVKYAGRNVSSDNSMMAGTKPAVAHAALESTADGKVSKSRSKQQRKKSQTMQRQDSKREANRVAAQKCRARKMTQKEQLDQQLQQALAEHVYLQQQAELLQRMHAREAAPTEALKQFVMAHRHYPAGTPLPPRSQQHLLLLLQEPVHPELKLLPDDWLATQVVNGYMPQADDEADSGDMQPEILNNLSSEQY